MRHHQQFSEEFKRSAVQKILLRGSKTVDEVCGELGITNPSFYDWKQKYGKSSEMKKEKRSQDWTPSDKFKAVVEFEGLSPENKGEYLRTEGLHEEQISQWREMMKAGLKPVKLSAEEKAERAADKQKVKMLERDLNRKNKALAEATALIILKKKADLIWGTGEDE